MKIYIYIYNGKITLEEADKDQSDLIDEIESFNNKTRPKSNKKKKEKGVTINNLNNFGEAKKMILNGFKSKILLTKSTGTGLFNTDNSKLKILTRK